MAKVKAFKIRQKDYHLVNEVTGQKITVFPPRWPGANNDRVEPRNEAGEWIRRFDIRDRNGITIPEFAGNTIVLTHAPKSPASIVINSEKWVIKVIEKEPVAAAPITDATAATPSDASDPAAKPKKAKAASKPKSKTKLMESVVADVKADATASASKKVAVKGHKALAKQIKGDKK